MIERSNDFMLNVKTYVTAGMVISLISILGECSVKFGAEALQFIHHFV